MPSKPLIDFKHTIIIIIIVMPIIINITTALIFIIIFQLMYIGHPALWSPGLLSHPLHMSIDIY